MKDYKVMAMNLGSTSTKLAYYVNDECVMKTSLAHSNEELSACKDIWDQYDFRKAAILKFMEDSGIDLNDLDAVSTRGGHCEPLEGGTYRINDAYRAQNRSGKYGIHVCNLGVEIANELAQMSDHAIAVTTDMPTTDELQPIARFTGLKELSRKASFQALNHRAMASYYAETIGRKYEELNLVVVMLGGGISVAAHEKGRMVDGPDALTGDGPFSNNRCCTVPVGQLVDLCYSGKFTHAEMKRHINGEAGLRAYLGTTDIRDIEKNIQNGDTYARNVLEAMCYQTAKEVGAYATVLKGNVDAILFIGGMAHSKFITEHIRERVEFIAPVVVLPGEREMESLCLNAYRAVSGQIPLKEFHLSN